MVGLHSAKAQELSVSDFHLDQSDISAVRYEEKDLNGNPCALVKVGLVLQDVVFEGSIIRQEFKDGEWWLYMVDGAWWLNIKTKKFLPLRYEFPESLQKKHTYILQVSVPQVAYTGPTGSIRISGKSRLGDIRDADIFVDGEKLSSVLPFDYDGPEGLHEVEVRAPGFNTERLSFEVKLKRKGSLTVLLKAEGSLVVKGVSYEMVNIPGGKFQMGSSSKNAGQSAASYEAPAHSVTLRTYRIGATEVTQALWKAVMGNNPSIYQGDDLPVENISWYDAQEFIQKLNAMTGGHYRLPTEAEWEYAARGGNTGPADDASGGKASKVAVTGSATMPPCSKAPNLFGVYDMSGNVAEWCSDWLSRYKADPVLNPTGPEKGIQKIIRGGSFKDTEWYLRCSFRGHLRPDDSNDGVGFRLASDY